MTTLGAGVIINVDDPSNLHPSEKSIYIGTESRYLKDLLPVLISLETPGQHEILNLVDLDDNDFDILQGFSHEETHKRARDLFARFAKSLEKKIDDLLNPLHIKIGEIRYTFDLAWFERRVKIIKIVYRFLPTQEIIDVLDRYIRDKRLPSTYINKRRESVRCLPIVLTKIGIFKGHLEDQDRGNLVKTAMREIVEELGISVRENDLQGIGQAIVQYKKKSVYTIYKYNLDVNSVSRVNQYIARRQGVIVSVLDPPEEPRLYDRFGEMYHIKLVKLKNLNSECLQQGRTLNQLSIKALTLFVHLYKLSSEELIPGGSDGAKYNFSFLRGYHSTKRRSGSVAKRVKRRSGSVAKRVKRRSGSVAKRVKRRSGSVAKRVKRRSGSVAKRVKSRSGSVAKRVKRRSGSVAKRVKRRSGSVVKRRSGSFKRSVKRSPAMDPESKGANTSSNTSADVAKFLSIFPEVRKYDKSNSMIFKNKVFDLIAAKKLNLYMKHYTMTPDVLMYDKKFVDALRAS